MAKKKDESPAAAAPASPPPAAAEPVEAPISAAERKRRALHAKLDEVLQLEASHPGSLRLGYARKELKALLAGAKNPEAFWAAKTRYEAASAAGKGAALEGLRDELNQLVERSFA